MEQASSIKRQVAYKVRIKDILEGKYVKENGWTPNYVIVNNSQISRVNIIAVVVSKEEGISSSYKTITIDDGSGKINARTFDKQFLFNNIEIGNIVLMIGRPREFGNEKYIVPELIKRIDDRRWIELRKLELKKHDLRNKSPQDIQTVNDVKEETINDEAEEVEVNDYQKICNIVRTLDKGEGADALEVVARTNIPNSEKIIEELLKGGELFEVKPGRLKIL